MSDNDKFVKQILRKYLFPTILTILSTTFISFINSIMAGRMLEKYALSAINIVSCFTFLFSMIGCLISIGSSTCASIAIGKDDNVKADKYVTYALLASIILPVIISIPCAYFFKEFMYLMGADKSLYAFSADYARIMILFGFLTTLMYFPFNFLRLDGRANQALYVFGIMAVVDIILVRVFIGFDMGLYGFGLAVVISTAIADIIGLMILFVPKESNIRLGRVALNEITKMTAEVFARGSAAGLNNLCNMLRTMILNAWVLRFLGTDGASEFAVACAIINLTAASVSGSGQTISPLVGIFHGEKDDTSMKMLMKNAVGYAVFIHIVMAGIGVPCARLIARLFGMAGEPLLSGTANAIIWVLISLLPASFINVYIYYYAAMKRTFISCTLTFCRAFGFVILFAFVILKTGQANLVFSSFLAAELMSIPVMFLFALIIHKKEPSLKGLLMMDDSDDENYISFSVQNTVEGAVKASQRMEEFFSEKDVSSKYTMTLPMALEELLLVVNEHCLKDMPDQSIDVRIFIDNDDILLRIRCGGKVFDPVAWYRKRSATMSVEEMLMDDSLGMKMIDTKAKDIIFQNTFGVNNLVVII